MSNYEPTIKYDPATGEVCINGQWCDENDHEAQEEALEQGERQERFRSAMRQRSLSASRR